MVDELESSVSTFTPHDVVWDDAKIARYWDYLSKVPAALNNCWSKQVGKALLRYVLRNGGGLRGRILDYGCGPGFLIGDLLEMGPDAFVYGAEYSQESVRLVNQRFRGHERFGGVSSAATIPTPYDDHYFDAVFFVETIEHIQMNQQLRALRELQRLLRTGGMVVVTTPNEESIDASKAVCPDCGATFHVVQHVSSWSQASLRSVMEEAGFRTISCAPTHLRARSSFVASLRDRLIRRRYLPHLIYLGRTP